MTGRSRTRPSLAADLTIALLFSTRLPLANAARIDGADIARASWALPLAGVLVGLVGAAIYWLAYRLGLAPLICAALAIAATLGVTGCLHEDGLADAIDGFGGGATPERKLDIMRDSRIGSYGVCALALSMLLRIGALAALADPALVAPALIAAHAAARAMLPTFLRLAQPARSDGLSAEAGRPALASAVVAGAIGAAALVLAFPVGTGLIVVLVLSGAAAGVTWFTMRQIGGQTGDVAGALEQVGECLVLLAATIA
jgi:adenosylcobinamide-GDP ribazoletransferase